MNTSGTEVASQDALVTAPVARMMEQGLMVMRAENETMRAMAIANPRIEEHVRTAALNELDLYPQYASKAYYVIPYKDGDRTVNVEGPSIKAAMALARRWGNCSNSARIVGEDDKRIQLQGIFIDFETGQYTARPFSVSKTAWSKKFGKVIPLRDDRLNMAIQAGVSKVVRNAILSALPVGLVEEYTAQAKKIAASGRTTKTAPAKPIGERLATMGAAFAKIGVEKKHIDAYLADHHELDSDEAVLAHMIGVYNAIEDNQARLEEVFPGLEKAAPAEPEKKAANGPTIGFEEQKTIRALLKTWKVAESGLASYLEEQYGIVGTANIPVADYPAVCKWIQGGGQIEFGS